MKPIDFFKLQAKNLFRDFKTQTTHFDPKIGGKVHSYSPKSFDVEAILIHFDPDDEKFTLMNAQHIIAQIAGFRKWTDMIKASEIEMQLAKLLFDNQHKINAEEWSHYITSAQSENKMKFDDETKLEIFKEVFANVEGHETTTFDYRLIVSPEPIVATVEPIKLRTTISDGQITSLPLSQEDRKEFIETANEAFERILERLEPLHPESTRKLWDPEHYIDHVLLPEHRLPISREYGLSLIDAVLVHHVLQLAVEADEAANKPNNL